MLNCILKLRDEKFKTNNKITDLLSLAFEQWPRTSYCLVNILYYYYVGGFHGYSIIQLTTFKRFTENNQ